MDVRNPRGGSSRLRRDSDDDLTRDKNNRVSARPRPFAGKASEKRDAITRRRLGKVVRRSVLGERRAAVV